MTQVMIQISPDRPKVAIDLFRSENGFESLPSYVDNKLIPWFFDNVTEAQTIRCSLSGWKIGTYMTDEIETTIRQAIIATNMTRFSDIMYEFKKADWIDAIESVVDQVVIRTLTLSRPSPVLSGSKGKPAVASAPRNRQLALLLNQLLHDTGHMRSYKDSFDTVERLRRAARLADVICAEWDGALNTNPDTVEANQFEDLYAGLVELDAKWQISALRFTDKEKVALEAHRDSKVLDIKALRAFVWSLVVYRDKHTDLNPSESWTKKAYYDVSFSSFNSHDVSRSNVYREDGPSNRHIKKPQAGSSVKKESKSKDPNRATFSSILKGLF